LLCQKVIFLEYFVGTFSMLAHSDAAGNVELFNKGFQTASDAALFAFMIIGFIPAWITLVILAYAHLELCGPKYNCCKEDPVSHHAAFPARDRGTYRFGLMHYIIFWMQVKEHMREYVCIAFVSQVLFYVCATVAFIKYQSAGVTYVFVIVIATLMVCLQVWYWCTFLPSGNADLTKFHRTNLFFPINSAVIATLVCYISMTVLFFAQPAVSNGDPGIFANLLPSLTPGEKAVFSLSLIVVIFIVPVQFMLAYYHRSKWQNITADKSFIELYAENQALVSVLVDENTRVKGVMVESPHDIDLQQEREFLLGYYAKEESQRKMDAAKAAEAERVQKAAEEKASAERKAKEDAAREMKRLRDEAKKQEDAAAAAKAGPTPAGQAAPATQPAATQPAAQPAQAAQPAPVK